MYSYRLKHICYLYNFFQNSSGITDTIIIWLTRSLQEISSQVTYLILDTDKLRLHRAVLSHSVVSDSLWPHGGLFEPARLLCPCGFSKQEYWSGLPCSSPGDLPNPGINPASLMSPAFAGWFFTTSTTREASQILLVLVKGAISNLW